MRRAAGLLALVAACSAEPDRRDLPPALREISGLAAASSGSVFAHDDERAVVHEIELATGRTIRRFALGSPPARGDFEGIAADRGRIYLIDSDGRLLAAAIGRDGEQVEFEAHETGAGADCEIEGLSLSPRPGHLLILCKRIRSGDGRGRLVIHEWSSAAPARVRRRWRDVDLVGALGAQAGQFAPSSIDWDAGRRQLVVVSARNRTMLVLDEQARPLAVHRLSAGRHPQPEGVAVVGDRLAIADEGERGRPARLTVYPFPLAKAGPQ